MARLIAPGEERHLDHDDRDRGLYLGPSHKRCNLRAAGKRGKWARSPESETFTPSELLEDEPDNHQSYGLLGRMADS